MKMQGGGLLDLTVLLMYVLRMFPRQMCIQLTAERQHLGFDVLQDSIHSYQ